jgi:glycosyltransferase involved in cell wall biosynthesis
MSLLQVLLSTFNGEEHLPAQLDSLLAQTYPKVSILVRDDGSSDGTTGILRRYAAGGHLCWYQGSHTGVRESFFDLLAQADDRAAAFAFCDQDDIWLPDKLRRMHARLEAEGGDQAVLYCGRARLVDDQLRPLGYSKRVRRGPSLGNALVENIAPGCTMAMNASARSLLLTHDVHGASLHDAWAYLVVSAVGRVVYDDEPMVLYRQHTGNVVGARIPQWRWWVLRLVSGWRDERRRRFLERATELERFYGHQLDPARRQLLDRFLRGRDRAVPALRYALRGDVYRQTTIDNLILKILIALREI